MREEFEKLPEIAEKLHTVVFSESHNTYHAKLINSPLSVMFVQGAWFAYQEQQKELLKMTEQDIRDSAPNGATHYMDDHKGFDYVSIDGDSYLSIWCSRFNTWLPVGYVAMGGTRFKPL